MGIKGLNKFLKLKFPSVFETCHIDDYSGKTVAIDAFSCLYRYVIVSDTWIVPVVNLIVGFLSHGVEPIFVLDGSNKKNKEEEMRRRKESKDKLEREVRDLEDALQEYSYSGTYNEILTKHMELLERSSKRKIKSFLSKDIDKTEIDVDLLRDKVERMRKQTTRLTSEHLNDFKQLLFLLKIQCIQGDSDAEIVCHHLVMNKKADFVLSTDSDFLCYGTPTILTSFDIPTGKCSRFSIQRVLEELGLTQKEFTDFCIMCGTDYNNNIPRVGPVLSYKQIQKYGSLEQVQEKSKYNVEVLNYKQVRSYYRLNDECKMEDLPVAQELDLGRISYFLKQMGVTSFCISKLERTLKKVRNIDNE